MIGDGGERCGSAMMAAASNAAGFCADGEPDGDEPQQRTARGFVVNKSTLAKWSGISPTTVDKLIADGAPIISKGTRKQGWQINTADFFGWYWRRKVEELTDDPVSGNFELAKRRDKESQTRLRDLQIAKLEGELIPIVDVERWVGEKYGVTRSRFLAVESQVPGLDEDQRDALRTALTDALADLSGGYRADDPAPADEDDEDDEDDSDDDAPADDNDDSESEGE